MRMKAVIVGAGLAGWVLSAHAYTSPYSSMAVPGDHNGWSTTPTMVLVADNTWVCTQTLSSASGGFKFAANNGWTVNWGGSASFIRVPAKGSAPDLGGGNLGYSGFSNGLYRFTFNDSTLECRLEWAGASPLPLPSIATLYLVGDFNGWTPSAAGQLTNSPGNTNLWSRSIDLESATTFQFYPDGTWSNQFGAPVASTIVITNLNAPVTNSACGRSDFTLSGFDPGTFRFELDTSNNLFTVTQTATQSFTIGTMTVQGNFIGTNNPLPNMVQVGDTTIWESDHHITNNGTITFRFSANSGVRRWGTTNGAAALSFPASGTLAAALTNYVQILNVSTGRYRITFNHITGEFNFLRSYTDASGINLLKNPGFEQTTDPSGGDAVDWGSWQAWPKRVADGYSPHSGNWCGAIHGQLFPEWTDYGSFAQDVLVTSGKTYQASAWFKASADWSASTMQIKIEWLDATNGSLGLEDTVDIPPLTNRWIKYSVEGAAPLNAAKAHVVFLCSGAGTTGTMQIDDAEMRAVAGRTQNFDTWGALSSFGSFAPDWSVTSGKTVWNVPPGRPEGGVLISQMVEGTGNNKAVEIFNGTLSNLDLSAQNYVLQQYDNGSLTASVTMALSGEIAAGACLVVARPGTPTNYAPDTSISGLANLSTNKYVTFNGDDVLVLRQGGAAGTVKDRIGQVSTNATGSIWSRSAKNHTLTRKSNIFTGRLDAVTTPFSLSNEWTISDSDTFDGLGIHDLSYLDPNEPYTPAGYSLVMNTNASLISGEMSGGIGDVSFWYRTESMSPAVTMVIETAATDVGPWTTNATLSGVASSNFAYYVVAINRADHSYLRIRQTGGATNRFRIDEVTVTEVSSTQRIEDFNEWTDPSFTIPGDYSRFGWSIQDGNIATTSGVLNTRAALISPPSGAVLSPAFEGGVGEVTFWAKANDAEEPAYLLLQTSIDGGSNWTSQASITATTGATSSVWLYLTNSNAKARIVFDPAQSSGDALVDNIEIALPALYRNQNFDSWPTKTQYTTGTASHQGWTVTNCIVDSQLAYAGQVARFNTTVGNFVLSPDLPGGIGNLSFRIAKWSASDAAYTLQVQVSPNGVGWTTLTNVSATSTNYDLISFYLYDTTNRFVRFYHSAGSARVLIDDIRIGVPQPRPEIIAAPGLDPANPVVDDPMTLLADVVARYGASVLSVTGYYRIATGSTNALPMASVGFGSYASVSNIPAQAAGTMIRYFVRVQYAGIGAASNSTSYTTNTYVSAIFTNYVSTVPLGNVWINEIFYAPYGEEWFDGYNHEFIELCGLAGSDVSGWTIQLAFGSSADIAANSNQPVYASYKIPTNTVFTNQTNGFSFYVLGDQELATNGLVDQYLTVYVPTNVQPFSITDKDHIYDGSSGAGVVRLLNQYSNLVYSLSYNGYASGSDRIPQSQSSFGETNSIGLSGSNYTYVGFTWAMDDLTIGTVNSGQILVEPPEDTNIYAYAWHLQTSRIMPLNTNDVPPFYMLDPAQAGHFEDIDIYYGYTNGIYPNPSGTLYHREGGIAAVWSSESMDIRDGSLDADGHTYVFGTIPAYTYRRLQSVEYVILVNPNTTGIDAVYLGSDSNDLNISTIYTNFAAAEAHPFTYLVPIADPIVITNFVVSSSNVVFQTDGNDPIDPLTHFAIRTSTNLLTPTQEWRTNSGTVTAVSNIYGQFTFTIPQAPTNRPKLYYRINPLWP